MYNLRKRFASASYTEEKDPTIKMKAKNWKKKKGGRLKCALCGKFFRQNRKLKAHIKSVHNSQVSIDQRDYKCDRCRKVFPSPFGLRRHNQNLYIDDDAEAVPPIVNNNH